MRSSDDYTGQTITVMGLGQIPTGSGMGAVKYMLRKNANLIITDLKEAALLQHQTTAINKYIKEIDYHGKVEYVMGKHREKDFKNSTLIIRHPDVPIDSEFLQIARSNNIAVESEMSLFFKNCPSSIIGITGTRGKSTTTALIAHLLKSAGKTVWMGGNIGQSPLDFLEQIKIKDLVVLELSSWMLESLGEHKLSPQTAVLLNVYEDHLTRHGTMDNYAAAKELITKNQQSTDVLICNRDNEYTRSIGEKSAAEVIWISSKTELKKGCYIKDNQVYEDDRPVVNFQQNPLQGQHNKENVLAAVACVRRFDVSPEQITQFLPSFVSLKGRLQFIDVIEQRTFINDTTATTPVATIAALQALQGRPIILIAGGHDKLLDFADFVKKVSNHVQKIIWLPGKGTDRIKQEIEKQNIELKGFNVQNMEEAVKLAYRESHAGDVILMSPACSSFGLFSNEWDRYEKFNEAVEKLK